MARARRAVEADAAAGVLPVRTTRAKMLVISQRPKGGRPAAAGLPPLSSDTVCVLIVSVLTFVAFRSRSSDRRRCAVPKVETRTDAAFKMSLTELEGVDELSTRVFRAFLNALRLHRQLMIAVPWANIDTHPGQAVLPAVPVGQRRRHPARPGRRPAPGQAHRQQDAPGDGEGRRDRAPARPVRSTAHARAPHGGAGTELETEPAGRVGGHDQRDDRHAVQADRGELEPCSIPSPRASPRRSKRNASSTPRARLTKARRLAKAMLATAHPLTPRPVTLTRRLTRSARGATVIVLLRERLTPVLAPDHCW